MRRPILAHHIVRPTGPPRFVLRRQRIPFRSEPLLPAPPKNTSIDILSTIIITVIPNNAAPPPRCLRHDNG